MDTVAGSRRRQVTAGRERGCWASPHRPSGGRGSWGAQPWPDPFSREAGRRAPLGPLRAPRTGPGALGAPRAGPQPREGQGPPPGSGPAAVPALTRGGGAGDTLQAQSYFPPLSPICHKVASEKGTHVTSHPCQRPRGLPAPTQGAHAIHPGVETGPAVRRAAGPRAASHTGQPRAMPSSKFLGGN